jgi:preprotein translocase subunit SecY
MVGTSVAVMGIVKFIIFVIVYFAIVVGIVYEELAERRIPIQYANRSAGTMMGNSNYIPFKLNSASVVPVIFASALITIPSVIAALIKNTNFTNFVNNYINYTSWTGMLLYVALIMFFGYFYTMLQMDPENMAKELNKNGGYIPGVRPGIDTTNYISKVLGRITVVGSLILVIIAILPLLFSKFSGLSSSVTIGGTGLLIVVGVAIETYKQIESSLISRSYSRGYRRR